MKLLGRTQPLSHYPIDTALQVIHRLGFDGVELCLEHPDLDPHRLTSHQAHAVGAEVQRLELHPHSVSLHVDYIYDETAFAATLQAIRLTRDFGTRLFVFAGSPARGEDADAWQRMLDRTHALLEVAADCDVVLAQEFEPGFIVGCSADVQRLLHDIPSPHLAVNLDLGHVFLCDPDPLQAIRQLGPYTVHGHVENMRAGVHRHLPPYEGDIDLRAYLHALYATGCSAGLALDLYQHDYEAVAPEAIRYLRECMPHDNGASAKLSSYEGHRPC